MKSKNHIVYLEKFRKDFISDLMTSIRRSVEMKEKSSVKANEHAEKSDWLIEEILHQAIFAQKKCKSFCGRTLLVGK